MNKKLLTPFLGFLTIAFFAFTTVSGQRLVSSVPNGTMQAGSINSRLEQVFPSGEIPRSSVDIDLRKIVYTSTDDKGKPVNLSGLVAMPRGGAPKGLAIFCHGTMQHRESAPSRYKGAANGSEAETAILTLATGGYAVVMPDYLGLGDHKGAHPYPLSIINAKSGVDIIIPARTLALQSGYNIGPELFITGYSEGGAIAMALTKELESMRGANYRVARSAPMAGPYDLSETMRQYIIQQPTTAEGFGIRLFFFSFAVNSYVKNNGGRLRDHFKPAMATAISLNYGRNLKDQNLVPRLVIAGTLMRAENSLKNVLQPRLWNALVRKDLTDPVVGALAANDVYDWAPRTPMLLVNLEGDQIVPQENTEKAFAAMRSKGVGSSMLRRFIVRDSSLNHITAVPKSMIAVRSFFDAGFTGVRGMEQ